MRIPPDYCLLGRKKSGVVTDGLQLWLDASDAPVSTEGEKQWTTNGNSITGYNAVTYADKVTGGAILLSKPSGANGDGVYYSLVHDGFVTVNNHTVLGRKYKSSIPSSFASKAVEGVWITSGRNISHKTSTECPVCGVCVYQSNYYVYDSPYTGGVPVEKYADGLPHHYIFQINNGIKEIYIDGNLISSASATNESLAIDGAINGTINQGFNGEIISFGCYRCYNKPLSPEEILQNYAYEKSLGRVS